MIASRVLSVLALLQLAGQALAGRGKSNRRNKGYNCSKYTCPEVGLVQEHGRERSCNSDNWVQKCCGEDPVCTQADCYGWKPYLNPIMMEPEPLPCSRKKCTRDKCCLKKDVCTPYDCDDEFTIFGGHKKCDGPCNAHQCCAKENVCMEAICTASTTKPIPKPEMLGEPCKNNVCTDDFCCKKDVCTKRLCDAHVDLPIFKGKGVMCDGPCDAQECCKKEECTEELGVCDDYYPVYAGNGVECEGKCDASECCDRLDCPEAVALKPKLRPQGICRVDGTKFEITGIEGVPMGFYVHKVNIVGSTAPVMENKGIISVVLKPNEAVDMKVTLASTSSGLCGPFRAVPVTPMCVCKTPEDCDTSNTGLICCEETDVCDYFNTGACGDPHMTGFLGQKFDFTGEDGQWYSLIADANMNVNMRVTSPVADLPEITYITGLSVLTTDADNYDHSIVIQVKDPHSLKSSCPTGVSPCLADGSLRVALDGEEALLAPGTVLLGKDVQISAVNLPGACRSFGFEKYWDRKRLESARHGRRLGEALGMGEWILDDPTATNMDECTQYVASAELTEGGLFAHQSEHASFQIVTPKAIIRLSHGRLHQIAMRDPTGQYDLPDHLTWQMNMAVDHNEVSRDAKGILGETWVPTRDSAGEPIMTGLEAIRGQQEDYLVEGALGTDFMKDEHSL